MWGLGSSAGHALSCSYALALALKLGKIMEYLSHGSQKILGMVYSVDLANFLWAASIGMLNSSCFF
jgi:hypothetical protein